MPAENALNGEIEDPVGGVFVGDEGAVAPKNGIDVNGAPKTVLAWLRDVGSCGSDHLGTLEGAGCTQFLDREGQRVAKGRHAPKSVGTTALSVGCNGRPCVIEGNSFELREADEIGHGLWSLPI